MPSVLEDFGLKAAIADVSQHLEGQVQFSCVFDISEARVNKYVELAIFRIVQELMLNVIKHSNATRAGVKVSIDSEEIFIRVEDNGGGMSNEGISKNGIGLSLIKSRVKMLDGEFIFDSQPGHGTTVIVHIPMHINGLTK
jgi:signal transduction histidine kinase